MFPSSSIAPPLWRDGPTIGTFYSHPGRSTSSGSDSAQHTLNPSTSGTSVLGIAFNGGIVLAADTLGSYGSLARYKNCVRVMKVNDSTVLAAGGDYADYQYLTRVIEQKVVDEECQDDGFNIKPRSLFSWVTRVLYSRRSKFDPLWNSFVIGGMQDGQPFIGTVDKLGTAFTCPLVATGYGAYIALPLMRDAHEKNPNMTQAEAVELITKCLRVLYYRDARSYNKYHLAIVTDAGARIDGPLEFDSNWEIATFIKET